MRITLGDVTLWFDVSGPSVVPGSSASVQRPTVVAVHGGPGLDHVNLKAELEPLAVHVQILYYDQRGHGRSDYGTAESWNLRTWADDLRRLCDALGLVRPVILGSSFGGHVALTYAGQFPGHAGGIVLANTTAGHPDHKRSVEVFRRLGGDEAASIAAREFAEPTEDSLAEFRRVCLPLYSSTPPSADEVWQRRGRAIETLEVNRHYFGREASRFDPWTVTGMVNCPVLILAGEDDPVCPIGVAEDLASHLPAASTTLLRLPGARHTVFRDRPDLTFPAVADFVSQVWADSSRNGGIESPD